MTIAGMIIMLKKYFSIHGIFCYDTVKFEELNITPSGINQSDRLLSAIKHFLAAISITDALSWFGLVNQGVWVYAISYIMQPFR